MIDLILDACDRYFFTPFVYPVSWAEDSVARQTLSIWFIVVVVGFLTYISIAFLNYLFIFDHKLMLHPLFLEKQIRLEIVCAAKSVPLMALPSVALFVLDIHGYSKLYLEVSGAAGWGFLATSIVAFLVFTDGLIYWIHRGLHSKLLYRYCHKTHHKWKVTTPFASHAFHPVDGFLQSLPYPLFPLLFPMHKTTYLLLLVFINIWTVSVHDGSYHVPDSLKPYINGSAHHTDHHLYYNYNYGQFFTFWDYIGGSFRKPRAFEGNPVISDIDDTGEEQSKDL